MARSLTNMRMTAILTNLNEMCEELSEQAGERKVKYPENINCDNQFNVKPFVDFFIMQGTRLWFSQPEQIHNNAFMAHTRIVATNNENRNKTI